MSGGGVDRATFMGRVSAALSRRGSAAPTDSGPEVDEAIARVTGPGEDLVSVFAARATETGMFVHRVRAEGAGGSTLALLSELGAKRVVVGDGSALAAIGATLRSSGIGPVDAKSVSGLGPLYEVDAGITDVQAAIAETGTLVCWSGPGGARALSLVPPVHIAVVRRSDIVPDLIDYFARHEGHGPRDLPGGIVFITGPSKTADIEGVLITGVHGPRAVHIILVEDA